MDMNIFTVLIFAVALSIDALGIGLSYGIRKIKISVLAKAIICGISVLFTEVALLIGSAALYMLPAEVSRFIGSGMLVLLGLFIIFEAIFKKEKNEERCSKEKISSFSLKHIGITIKIIKDPVLCDFNKSANIDPLEAVYLGVALSIDSFGVGIGSAATGVNSIFIPIFVGAFQILFLCIGCFLGKKIYKNSRMDSKVFVLISGVLIIALAIVRAFF